MWRDLLYINAHWKHIEKGEIKIILVNYFDVPLDNALKVPILQDYFMIIHSYLRSMTFGCKHKWIRKSEFVA